MARANWGKAKHQVLVLRNEIISLLADGENLEGVFQKLVANKSLPMCKRTFKRHAARIRDELCTSPSHQSIPSTSANDTGDKIAPAPTQPGVFNHNSADADKTLEREW